MTRMRWPKLSYLGAADPETATERILFRATRSEKARYKAAADAHYGGDVSKFCREANRNMIERRWIMLSDDDRAQLQALTLAINGVAVEIHAACVDLWNQSRTNPGDAKEVLAKLRWEAEHCGTLLHHWHSTMCRLLG